MNNKQRQSSLFKKKAILKYIIEAFKNNIKLTSLYADDNDYITLKSPANNFYGYKVIYYYYKIKLYEKKTTKLGFSAVGRIIPNYSKCKVEKIK